jgi:hypothetical protein
MTRTFVTVLAFRRPPKSVRRNLFATLLLVSLLGAGSCHSPTSPTTCVDACLAPANSCLVLATGSAPQGSIAMCNTTYEECKAKCR